MTNEDKVKCNRASSSPTTAQQDLSSVNCKGYPFQSWGSLRKLVFDNPKEHVKQNAYPAISNFDVLLLQGDALMQSHLCHNFSIEWDLRNLGTTEASLMQENPKCSTKSLDYGLCGYYPCTGGCTTANTPHNDAQKVLKNNDVLCFNVGSLNGRWLQSH